MKHRQVAMIAATAILLGLFCFGYARYREPRYEGRSLSAWLDIYESDQSQEAAVAVRQIGTKAVPFLATWLRRSPPWYQVLWEKVASWKRGTPGRQLLLESLRRPQPQGERALWGFVILGETARSAAPDLTRIATHGNATSANLATTALCYLGRDGLEPLFSLITNAAVPQQTKISGLCTLIQMPHLATNAHHAAALLIRCLHDPDPIVVQYAAIVLGTLHQEEGLCVPALIECTRSTNELVRLSGAVSLMSLAPDDRTRVVPEFTRLLSDPADSVRGAATNALQRIAPEVLQQTYAP